MSCSLCFYQQVLTTGEKQTSELAPKYPGHVYILASEGDTYAAQSSRQLYDIFPGDKRLNIINGKLHGTNMFDAMPELIDELLNGSFK